MADTAMNAVDTKAEKAFAEAAAESVAVAKPAVKIETVAFPPREARAPAGVSPTVSPAVSPKAAAVSLKAAAVSLKAAAVSPKAPAVAPKAPVKKAPAKKSVVKTVAAKAPVKAGKVVAKKPTVAKKPVKAAKPAATVHQFPSFSQIPSFSEIKDQTMTKTTEVTEGVKKFATEAQGKAKIVLAKGKVVFADAGEFTKGNVEAIVASGKILGKGVKTLGEVAIADTRAAIETVGADVKAAVAVKTPTELVKLQGDIARRNLDTVISTTQKNSEALVKLASDVFAPLSARFSLAASKVKKAA